MNQPEPIQLAYCNNCRDAGAYITAQLQNSTFERDYHNMLKRPSAVLGNLKAIDANKDCDCCQSIISALIDTKKIQEPMFDRCEMVLQFDGILFHGDIRWAGQPHGLGFIRPMLLQTKTFDDALASGRVTYGTVMDERCIDTVMIRRWINSCDDLHSHAIHRIAPLLQKDELPWIYLIDVKQKCIVKVAAEKKPRYAALSYVWGQVKTFKTTRRNLSRMLEPGSISLVPQEEGQEIAQTIKDALHLMGELECPYFWTDCLCIVQRGDEDEYATDEEEAKKRDEADRAMFLNAMAFIYANAYFTVVVGLGDNGDAGIPGIGSCAKPRDVGHRYMRFPGHTLMMKFLEEDTDFNKGRCVGAPWSSRGWTFQEAYFSRRLLVFQDNVFFFCRDHKSEEWNIFPHGHDRTDINNRSGYTKHLPGFISDVPSWPDVRHLAAAIGEYSSRDLSFDDDVLWAFAGALTVLKQYFYSGFYFGIPEMLFDVCLLWEPDINKPKPLTRRQPKKKTILPSWSWVSVKGTLSLEAWSMFGMDFYKDATSSVNKFIRETTPLVRWRRTDSNGEELEAIEYKDFGGHTRIPSGWTCTVTEGKWSSDVGYSHPLLLDKTYPMPFPLPDAEENDQPSVSYGPALLLHTSRAWLFRSERIQRHSFRNRETIFGTYSLRDGQGTWAGALIDDQLDGLDSQSMRDANEACDLIVISKGRLRSSDACYFSLFESKLPENPCANRQLEYYEYYNVLWIRWEGGIAYRRGIGRVLVSVWDSLSIEKLEVRLS